MAAPDFDGSHQAPSPEWLIKECEWKHGKVGGEKDESLRRNFFLWALPPSPRDLPHGCHPEILIENETGCHVGHPASVLAPGSALGLLPSIALSSAQAKNRIAEI
jgi:hypothetical protein